MSFNYNVRKNCNIFLLGILLLESLGFCNHRGEFNLVILHLKIIKVEVQSRCKFISHAQKLHQKIHCQHPTTLLSHQLRLQEHSDQIYTSYAISPNVPSKFLFKRRIILRFYHCLLPKVL